MQSPGHSRRAVLLAGTSLALAACSDDKPAAKPVRSDPPDPDQAVRRRAAHATAALIAAYDAALAVHPPLAGRLTPLRAELLLHRAAFGAVASAAPTTAAPTTAAPATAAPAGQGSPGSALAAVAAAERRTADSHTAALAGVSPELARLLASVAAANMVHAALLAAA